VDRDELIGRLEGYFRRRPAGLAAVYLFGSQARRTARKGSDVDLVLGGPPDRIADELGQDLRREVQVVVLNRAPADLVHRVLRDGVLIHEGDRSARVRFEVAKRNEYFDLLPVLRRYRRLEGVRQ